MAGQLWILACAGLAPLSLQEDSTASLAHLTLVPPTLSLLEQGLHIPAVLESCAALQCGNTLPLVLTIQQAKWASYMGSSCEVCLQLLQQTPSF